MKKKIVVRKEKLIDLVVVVLANAFAFSVASLVGFGYLLSWGVLSICSIFVLRKFRRNGPLGIVLFTGGLVLYMYPYLGFYLSGNYYPLFFYSMYIFAAFFLMLFGAVDFSKGGGKSTDSVSFLVVCLILAVASLHVFDFLFVGFLGLSFLFLDRVCRSHKNDNMKVYICTFLIYTVIFYHVVFVWSGFGRIGILILIMIPAIILFTNKRVTFYSWQVSLISFPALLYGLSVRMSKDASVSVADFGSGSAAHHLVLMSDLYHHFQNSGVRAKELFEQFSLMLLNWMPREFWPDKPLSIGYWFVDEQIGRAGFGEKHNVSLGLWGEHIYLMNPVWVLSGIFAVAAVCVLAKVIYRLSFRSHAVMVVFYTHLLSFVWGGMAAFGARVWFCLLPILLFLWYEKLVIMLKNKNATVNALQ